MYICFTKKKRLKNIKILLKGFLSRAGSYLFLATIIARISNFLAHLIVLYFISKNRLGVIIYAYSFIMFLLPLSGLGIQQSLIRYGARLSSDKKKNELFKYVFKKGLQLNILFIILLIPFAYFYPFKFETARFYFLILTLSLIPHFLVLLIKIYFRLFYKNKIYAKLEISQSILFLILVIISTYFYKENGYVFAIITTPLLIFIYYFARYIKLDKIQIKKPNFINLSFWKYGFFAGLSYVATIFLFEIDKILIGNILQDPTKVTIYGYVALIPMSLLFLPRVLITADFVYVTENITNKKYIYNYIKTYISLFLFISIAILLVTGVFSKYILLFLFGKDFTNYTTPFLVLTFGISGILILRGLFGNLLSAIGKAELNFIIVLTAIVINIISNYYFIAKYGVLGAAITSAFLMWFTGILSCLLFFIYYHKMLKEKSIFTS